MITNDATLLKVKHEVLYEVAKLAYEGRLDDERDNLPYKMVPGPQPFFRWLRKNKSTESMNLRKRKRRKG